MANLRWLRSISLLLIVAVGVPTAALAQFGRGSGRRGGGGGMRSFMERMQQMQQQNQAQPATDANKPKEEPKKDEKSAEPKSDPGPKPLTRPSASEKPNAGRDQKLVVDSKKQITVNFEEAPWDLVLEELARVSDMNLDWQQLPGDTLNLRSAGKYTAAQLRDILNANLIARGYAILSNTKTSTLTVVSLDNLNTALVPRVAVEELASLPPHDLVKVSFRLDWLLADKAVDEFKQMLSPKAKLLALKATNRLDAIDAVENLRQLAEVIEEEQGGKGSDSVVREFELRHTRASDVLEQLQLFLGIKKDASGAMQPRGFDPAAMMAMQQRMQQQGGQPGQQPMMPGGALKPEIKLMANMRRNSILANAPPDQMAIIKSAIWKLDVATERPSLSENGQLMQTYRLATLDPELVVNFLEAVGDLDPQTKLDIDKKNRAVVAYASARDQKAIASLVKNLDGSDRQLKVIKLRRLDADLVAGTLRTLLVGEDKKNDSSSGRRRYGWFDFSGSNNSNEEPASGKFRVDADVINNRLIVWANPIEFDQVQKCLAELGEIPRREHGQETMRVLDTGAGDEGKEMLERIRRIWPKDANRLIIDVPEPKKEHAPTDDDEQAPAKPQTAPNGRPAPPVDPSAPAVSGGKLKEKEKPAAPSEPSARREPLRRDRSSWVHLVGLERTGIVNSQTSERPLIADASAGREKSGNANSNEKPERAFKHRRRAHASQEPQPTKDAAEPAEKTEKGDSALPKGVTGDPIVITRGADGKLIISSRDTQALDSLEELMARLAPPRKDYAVFHLKYASASSVKFNLDEYFGLDKKDTSSSRRRYYWDEPEETKKDDAPRLSQRKPLRFIYDPGTNTILVQGADPEQLRLINELIQMYDQPEPKNSRAARMTRPFPIHHAKATAVADVIKDVYRDLLSPVDKALESYNDSKSRGRTGERTYIYDFADHEDDGKINQNRFKGQLSVGVDDSSNTLIVSCPESLMRSIEQMVEYLDKAALPVAQTFQVLRIDRSIDAGMLQKRLEDMLKKPGRPAQQRPNPQGPQQQQQQRQGRNRGQQQQQESNNNAE